MWQGTQRVEDGTHYISIKTFLHPASYPMGTGGPFPGGKARPGRDADHSPHLVAEIKYE
jgi:hypothetical protein